MTTPEAKPRLLGLAVDEETLRADLARYCAMALELGASGAAIIPASDVVIDERVRLKCVVPRCFRAGETPYCPPACTRPGAGAAGLEPVLVGHPVQVRRGTARSVCSRQRNDQSRTAARALVSPEERRGGLCVGASRPTRTVITWPWGSEAARARTTCARGCSASSWIVAGAGFPIAPRRAMEADGAYRRGRADERRAGSRMPCWMISARSRARSRWASCSSVDRGVLWHEM